ncbi:hypothetical protein WJX73_002989 [Symbiochloris irregularis]|uniref:Choline transporter-like protein n=1 Tax=Symbiochloris irregularis TaxID=706552 RepID=A0AAW1PZV4_9CHLO
MCKFLEVGLPFDPQAGLQLEGRVAKDLWAGVVFIIFLILTYCGGIYAVHARNLEFSASLSTANMNDPGYCPTGPGRGLMQASSGQDVDYSPYATSACLLLVVSTLISLVGGYFFVISFKYRAEFLVRATVIAQIVLPAVAGIILLVFGLVGAGIFCLGAAALMALAFYLWRGHLQLCARLLGVSATGLRENPALLGVCVVTLTATVCLLLPIWGSLGASVANGSIQPNGYAQRGPAQCTDASGHAVPCCVWVVDSWVPVYLALNIVTMIWTVCLMGEMIRNIAERGRQGGRGDNILFCLLAWALECCLQFIEFLTRFAVVRAAITGEAFLTAGRNAADLFKRNFLKAYAVWWIPPAILRTAALLISAVYGLVVFGIACAMWIPHHHQNGLQAAIMVGIAALVLSLIVHSFFAGILLNIVDVVFMCYAMDRDSQAVTRGEVHEIMGQLPVGVAVENPDGAVRYGAPVNGTHGPNGQDPSSVPLQQRMANSSANV